MSLNIADNFSYLGRKPLDTRLVFETISDMQSIPTSQMYVGLIAYNLETKQFYMFDDTGDASVEIWKPLKFGGGEDVPADMLLQEYQQDHTYLKDTLIYCDEYFARVLADYVSDNTESGLLDSFLLDVANGKIDIINDHSRSLYPYTQDTEFEVDTLVYNDTKIAKVVDTFISDSTETDVSASFDKDIVDGNLYLINQDFESPIEQYKQGTVYTIDKLLFNDKRIFRCIKDFMSSSIDPIEDAIYEDLINDNIIEMSENYKFKFYECDNEIIGAIDDIVIIPFSDILFENNDDINDVSTGEGVYDSYGTLSIIKTIDKNNQEIEVKIIGSRTPEIMPPAPKEHKVQVTVGGLGYQVGDELPTSLPNEFHVVVDEVDDDGQIETVTLVPGECSTIAHGYGAIIEAIPIFYAGHGEHWYAINDDSAASGEVGSQTKGGVQPYTPGVVYHTNEVVFYDNIFYRVLLDFESSNDGNLDVAENLDIDLQLGNLLRISPEEINIPEFIGTLFSDESSELPDNVVPGNWGLVIDCVVTAPGQPGIAVYTTSGWSITPIPQGELQFPEPPDDGSLNFRKLDSNAEKGEWVAFTEVDGNKIALNIKASDDSDYVPAAQELVWYENTLVIGDGTSTLMDIVPFYKSDITAEVINNALGYIPEDTTQKGIPYGYAPLDKDGLVPKANLPLEVTDTYSKSDIDQKDLDTLVAANAAVATEAARADAAETAIADDLSDHVNNTSLHVTQSEKDGWDSKVDSDDLQPFTQHVSDTVIHVTQADKDKWNGMSRAYFVTKVSDLPTTGNDIGNIGYVQVSAAGVSPMVCHQYLWNGTKWELVDSSGVTLTFNWGNLEGKPGSTPLSIDNAVTIAHNHINKTILDKIGQTSNGDFTFDGVPIGIRAVFLQNQFGLPDVGQEDILYVIYEDSRVRNFPSISVWKDGAFQVLGRGTQDAPPTGGEMSILQAEYFGVAANSSFNISITPDVSFCFLPVEILKEIEGEKNVQTIVTDFSKPDEFQYDNQVLDISSAKKLIIDNKNYPTNIDTVGDMYFSSVDINLHLYNNVTGIE